MEYFGSDYIDAALKSNSDVTTIVGTSIYPAVKVPETDASLKTINYYTFGPFNGGLEYFTRSWSIDCRSDFGQESRDLAFHVYETLNRIWGTAGSKEYYAVCTIINTIPPIQANDVYNTPVQVLLRRR